MNQNMKHESFIRTSEEDPLKYYSWPVIGSFYRRRLTMVTEALGKRKFNRLLEIGYGSGIFMPELAQRARQLYGVDIHEKHGAVAQMLAARGVTATLTRGNVARLPYSDNQFDCVIAVSILEHIRDLEPAVKEIRRVLRPGGILVAGAPVKNRFMDSMFRCLMRFDSSKHHPNGHRTILESAGRHFAQRTLRHFPSALPLDYGLYFVLEAEKK
jgi:ubiquinone/menaquinone biosynthesis C-methylase UbiE